MSGAQGDPGRALVVMSHPDDAEILVGGTLLRLAEGGWATGIVTMTSGDCGSTAERTNEEIAAIRHAEAERAAASIGAWYAWAGVSDVAVFANAASVRAVVELVRRFDPDVVITHAPVDYMLDHEETVRIARAAVFAAAAPLYRTHHDNPAAPARGTAALYYADPVEGVDHAGVRVTPDFYVDIADRVEAKRALLAHHESQREWLRAHHGIDEYLDRMTEWSAAYGRECGVAHAEGFRQHLGHGYSREPRLQNALRGHLRTRLT